MFGKSKNEELIDRELEIYKKEKLLAIDIDIEAYRNRRQTEVQDLAKRCHEELGVYEHTYHSAKETKGIEIAKLEAKKEALEEVVKSREEVVKADDNLLKSKDAEIKRLSDIVNLLISKQPSTIVHQGK